MMSEQLDRVERKINLLAHLIIAILVLIAVLAVVETPSLWSFLQNSPWIGIGAAAVIAFVLLLVRRPFRA
jgi:Na+/proline symporter